MRLIGLGFIIKIKYLFALQEQNISAFIQDELINADVDKHKLQVEITSKLMFRSKRWAKP